MLGGDQDPVLAATVAAQLDVVAERRRRSARSPPVRGARRLGVSSSACTASSCEAQARRRSRRRCPRAAPAAWSSSGISARPIAGSSRASGCSSSACDELRGGVGREAQPPALIWPREVEHALVAAAPRAPARDRAVERVADLRRSATAPRTGAPAPPPGRGRAGRATRARPGPSGGRGSRAAAGASRRRRGSAARPRHGPASAEKVAGDTSSAR